MFNSLIFIRPSTVDFSGFADSINIKCDQTCGLNDHRYWGLKAGVHQASDGALASGLRHFRMGNEMVYG